ncbi:hypothetical protein O181_032271 [Austropuccinia psidii MF-1]|uniref:Uncharacterized protein n=1 Tax=Austropuccinia psidii MF-1 TaxID=1389203 RepID=A0A9Q3CWH3_9BASI|nr:hypothetical protein [Austropuccinia psidii MF-1]
MLPHPQDPQDMPPTPEPHLRTHPSLCFSTPLLTILPLLQDPQYMPPMLPPYVLPHPSLHFCTPAAYHAYAPAGTSRYASNAATPCPPSPILTLPPPAISSLPLTLLALRLRLIGYGGLLAYNTITEIF